MATAKDIRCVYCGQRGAKPRGGQWTCHACRDLPAYERNAAAEVELMIAAYYEGKLSKSAEGHCAGQRILDPVEPVATVAGMSGCVGHASGVAGG